MPRPLHILIAILGLAGGWIWSQAGDPLRGPDGLPVLSLLSVGTDWRGVGAVAGWGVGAGVLSLGMARLAGARWGMLVAATAGFVVAFRDGPIDGLLRYEAGRGLYVRMLVELVVLQGVGVLWLAVLSACARGGVTEGRKVLSGRSMLAMDVAAGVLAALVAAVAGQVLIRSSAGPQVTMGVLVGFVVAAVVVQAAFGREGVRGVLILGPVLLGLGVYGVMAWRYGDGQMLLRAWYEGRLSGLGVMLPGQIVAAGWLGGLLGERIGRGMGASIRHGEADEAMGGIEEESGGGGTQDACPTKRKTR